MRRKSGAPGLSEAQRSTAWQVQSLLLGYPDEALLDSLPLLARAVSALPEAVAAPLQRVLDYLETTRPLTVATRYVDTFDHRKRFSPYLTWFFCGDTRRRGMALLKIKQVYLAAGLVPGDDELPDHLAVALEFASAHPEPGRRLLEEHRAGIEVIRMALRDADSPWAGVLESVSATLRPLHGEERAAVVRLIAAGPPEEGVGLEPFAPPAHQPAMLGMPHLIGGRR
ncbi:nitrate reductase molybdenum cofactor assembly chaperone [Nocardia yunnanensis]|uniref:Nitrate reductase molybdenum cofactor assembly chaperone n=1 Tax=Nocardia yunnanensis TaxID=2382165 RepID=A0A386ZLB4_9NOCA|nr:nitrate reductase molybdenum cofactor assembly chaperone [Nocardia yunnanensis]AYF78073.1 nitrate reductase molybdenum cofactor assembly chaperone [Nocardia yunnanensis]